MILPCIDLMGEKVVQLVQGREKALEGDSPARMMEKFAGFPQIQVIDLDAAIGSGENNAIVAFLASHCQARVGGGIRTMERARALIDAGAHRVIVGTSAFSANGINREFLGDLNSSVARDRIVIALDSKHGRIVVKGWQESIDLTAEQVVRELEPFCSGFLCTYVDKEGMMQGTDLAWFARLREITAYEITAAGGITTIDEIRALDRLRIHSAVGMAVYTGHLDLSDLARMNRELFALQ
jgi:phosphoribosylformimino-5-aminoimidazole carboxamide ribotide isomerase